MPFASVVIPTYNRAELVCRAVESCLAQTVADIEVIVVDDGSTDDTATRISNYRDRLIYLRQENSRQGAARNLGISRATSEWILFLDSDDCFLPNKLKFDLETARANPDAVLLHGGVRDVLSNGRVLTMYRPRPDGHEPERLVLRNSIVGSTVAIRREALHALGGFRTERELAGSEDWELWLRAAVRYPIRTTGVVQVDRTLDTSGMMANPDNMARSMRWALRLAFEDPMVAGRIGHLRRRAEAVVATRAAAGYATERRRRQAIISLREATSIAPSVALSPLFLYTLARALLGIRSLRRMP